MACFPMRPAHLGRHALVAVLVLATTFACSKRNTKADSLAAGSNAPVTSATSAADSTAGMPGMGAAGGMQHDMANMTGNADHDFLRMMSDHHKGLILLAHMTKDRKAAGTAGADAAKLDAAQDKELDHMVTMLEKDFKDPYAPKVMPQHQALADALKSKGGKDYDRTFYQNVIQHHQEALTMIDEYLPRSKNAMLKQMAEQMKADQSKEIADFQRKVAKLQS